MAFSSKSTLRCKTLFVILATMIVTMPFWGCGEDEEEFIPFNGITSAETSDPNLEAAIREELDKPLERITAEDLAALTELRAAYRDISNLAGIQYCVNLRYLDLDANQISDLSPLSGLTNLQFLYLIHNQISDLSPLSGLTNLQFLYLLGNQISDLSPLSSLTNLQELKLNANQISDLSPLSSLTNLRWLDLMPTR